MNVSYLDSRQKGLNEQVQVKRFSFAHMHTYDFWMIAHCIAFLLQLDDVTPFLIIQKLDASNSQALIQIKKK